jgi:hypothetical protein
MFAAIVCAESGNSEHQRILIFSMLGRFTSETWQAA